MANDLTLNEIRLLMARLPCGWAWRLQLSFGHAEIEVFSDGRPVRARTFTFFDLSDQVKRDPREAAAAAIDFARNSEHQTADDRRRREIDAEIPF